MLQIVSTIKKDKESKRKVSNDTRLKSKMTTKQKHAEKFEGVKKEEKKRKFRFEGLESSKKQRT